MAEHALEIGLLGPIKTWIRDAERYIGPPRQREVLAVLALCRGRVVSVGQLTAAVWGARAPARAENLVHTYVGRLRRALDRAAEHAGSDPPLRSHRPGYSLLVEPERLDVTCFEEDVARARGAVGRGDLAAARAELRQALARWRGPALHEASGPLAEAERARLNEMRQEAVEELLSVRLLLGDHQGLVPDLKRMVAEQPLRERLWALLLVALDRMSRRAEALTVYHEARAALGSRLGVEPGRELQALHRDLLRSVPVTVGYPARASGHGRADPAVGAAGPAVGPVAGRAADVVVGPPEPGREQPLRHADQRAGGHREGHDQVRAGEVRPERRPAPAQHPPLPAQVAGVRRAEQQRRQRQPGHPAGRRYAGGQHSGPYEPAADRPGAGGEPARRAAPADEERDAAPGAGEHPAQDDPPPVVVVVVAADLGGARRPVAPGEAQPVVVVLDVAQLRVDGADLGGGLRPDRAGGGVAAADRADGGVGA